MREPPGPLWGRAASCCLLPRQISGRREACPPARRPRRELRSARRLEARPGPAGLAAASNRSGCLCDARPGLAAAHGYRSQALSASWAGCLKPLSPLRVPAEPRLKPSSPLWARNGRFWCIFRLQWCCRFQWSLFGGEQWCRRFHAGLHQWLQRCYWFQSWHVAVSCARKVRPAWPGEGASAKSSPSARKMAPNPRFLACWASFFAEMPLEGVCWASFFAEMPMVGVCWGVTAGRDPVGSRPVSQARITSGPPHTRTRRARVEREPRSLLRRIRGSGVAHALGNRVGDRRGDDLGTHESRE